MVLGIGHTHIVCKQNITICFLFFSFILLGVIRHIHQVSGFFFYVLGSSFFVAFVLFQYGIGGQWPILWLHIVDVPLFLFAILYGGFSVYFSLTDKKNTSFVLLWTIILCMMLFFSFFLALNFWPTLT